VEDLASWHLFDQLYGHECDNLSVFHNFTMESTFREYGAGEFFVTDQRGYNYILSQMGHPNIFFGHKVLNIAHSRDRGAEVTTDKGIFRAGHVIITVSIGVLNAGVINFEPALPRWKTQALKQCKMSTYTKIFIKFSD
jgi:polyamine oxidase